MMRYAIFSDVHDRRGKLQAVLADAWSRGADRFVSLGDVGGDDCVALLREVDALVVFGNYEVSGWRRLSPAYGKWVRSWPPLLAGDGFLAVHAAPWWPEGLRTVEDFGAWLKRTGQSWRALFPYLNVDEDYLWQALAELEMADKAVLFHGHTHQQAIWRWAPTGRMQQVRAIEVEVKAGYHYVVGVGSAGLPQEGGWADYTLYDAELGRIEQIRLEEG